MMMTPKSVDGESDDDDGQEGRSDLLDAGENSSRGVRSRSRRTAKVLTGGKVTVGTLISSSWAHNLLKR